MGLEKERNNKDKRDLEEKYFKTKKEASFKVLKQELRWNKEGINNFCKCYGSKLRSFKKNKKMSLKIKKNDLKLYNIRML